MISQIARLQLEEAHRDDGYPNAAFAIGFAPPYHTRSTGRLGRRERARRRAERRARAPFQEPLLFSSAWAATEIQRMWRGFVNRPTATSYLGPASREYLARWNAVQLIQRVWRGYAARCALPEPDTPGPYELLDVGLYDIAAIDARQYGCQFPHQCEHRGRSCELWCPNNPLQSRPPTRLTRRVTTAKKADRMPPTCETTCEKCSGSGYYTSLADARGHRKVFLTCHDCADL